MDDKFTITKGTPSRDITQINVRRGTYGLIKQMAAQSGMSMIDFVEEMVKYCFARFEVEVDEE